MHACVSTYLYAMLYGRKPTGLEMCPLRVVHPNLERDPCAEMVPCAMWSTQAGDGPVLHAVHPGLEMDTHVVHPGLEMDPLHVVHPGLEMDP